MTIDTVLGLGALGLAFGAAAIRSRDWFWAIPSIALFGVLGYRLISFGFESTSWTAPTDRLLVLIGMVGMAVTITVTMGLPRPIQERLVYGPALRIARFERALLVARRPFLDAAVTWDPSMAEKARWRGTVAEDPRSDEWASLADRVAAADVDWAEYASTGDASVRWEVALRDAYADWVGLRERDLGHRVKRASRLVRLLWFGFGVSAVLALAGNLDLTNGLFSAPPSGRAPWVPPTTAGRTVQFAPLGGFPVADLRDLAAFYATRYGIEVQILPPVAIPREAHDPASGQLVAEPLIETLRGANTETGDWSRVVIAFTDLDLHIRGKPDWGWAFGMATEGHLAVLSTARMGPEPGPFGHQLETARLRKMVTKYIGILYFDLSQSVDPRSVRYNNILGVPDLDAMGEDY